MKKRKPATRAASTKVASRMEQESRWPRPTTLRLFNNGDPVAIKAAEDANEAISRAEYFQDYSQLCDRLRRGLASREEMAVAAYLIEGKHLPEKRSRGGQPTASFGRSLHIANHVTRLVKGGKSKKAAVSLAAEEFGLSEPRIYAALKSVKEEDGVANILLREILGF